VAALRALSERLEVLQVQAARELGTPELVEEEIVRRAGLGAGAGLFAGLDRDALATIGIDLDAVRARIEASFGPQALTSAAQAAHQDRPGHPGLRPPRIARGRRRARWVLAHAPGPRPPATGRYRAPGPPRAAILDRYRQAS
jgi:hypothetical protein